MVVKLVFLAAVLSARSWVNQLAGQKDDQTDYSTAD
jgi:hypothetical protein